ncbi:MAG: hypothetical protein EA376_02420 [Phycisphaeraceae bacterium]|nr:MAG: hypothetical protein EA376_02420 [Phycisphaeraceae bacterium]
MILFLSCAGLRFLEWVSSHSRIRIDVHRGGATSYVSSARIRKQVFMSVCVPNAATRKSWIRFVRGFESD